MKNLNSTFLAILIAFYGVFALSPALALAKNDNKNNGHDNGNKDKSGVSWSNVVSSIRSNPRSDEVGNGSKKDLKKEMRSFFNSYFNNFYNNWWSNWNHNNGNNNGNNQGDNKPHWNWEWQRNHTYFINGIKITPSDTSAVIDWTTSTTTNGTISYGTAANSLTSNASETSGSFTLSHELTLTGLTPNTKYFYYIKTQDNSASSTVVQTAVRSFKTASTTTSTANVTTNAATNITATSATTNGTNGPLAASDTSFWIGTTSAGPFTAAADPTGQLPSGWYGVDSLAQSASGAFSYNYTGLSENTTYYFVAWSNVGGVWYPGAVLSFTTGVTSSDTNPPDIIFATNLGLHASTTSIIWVTNEASDSKVWIGTASPVSTSTSPVASSGTLSYFHQLNIPSLATSTLYYYTISSTDSSGNTDYYSSSFTSQND